MVFVFGVITQASVWRLRMGDKLDRKKQCTMVIVRLAIGGIGFLLLPLFFHIYFLKAYYVFSSAIMFIGTVKHLVCLNRKRLREQPYLLNVVREGLLFTTWVVTSFSLLLYSLGVIHLQSYYNSLHLRD